MIKTLEGIKVVSFTKAAAGISCAKILAEYGAEVYFIEPVTGAPLRKMNYREFYMNGLRSMPINLRDPKGMELLHKLLANSDVFISNYRAKALKAMGLDYETLKEKYPRLVHATVTGYGEHGPMKDAPGFDITAFWARAGLINDVMERGSSPMIAPAGMGDTDAGFHLAMGVVSALFKRATTGEGMKVYISLYSLGLYLNHAQIIDQEFGKVYPKTRKDPGRALKNSFHCSNGWIQTMVLDFNKHFNSLLKVIRREDLIGDPRWTCIQDTEGEKAIELTEILDEAFAKLTVEEASKGFEEVDMAYSAYYTGLQATQDEQAAANQFFADVVNKNGETVRIPCSPIKFGDDTPADMSHTDQIGESTVSIMKEYGYSDEEIEQMIADNVVASMRGL